MTIPYDLEGDDTVPETADVPLIDEESGTEFERELSLVDVEETSRSWSDTFSFSVTVSGYGADSFYLGDMEIPGDADLADYGEKTFRTCRVVPGILSGEPGGMGRRTLYGWGGDVQKCDCRRK